MRKFAIAMLALLVAAPVFAANDTVEDGEGVYIEPVPGEIWGGARDVLFDNGPVKNCDGCGVGGADESILQVNGLSMGTYGFGHQIPSGLWVGDDFTIPAGETWTINSMTFFGYQTNSPTSPSPFTQYHVMIYDDFPPFGNVVYGDDVTNVLTSSVWTNIYRVSDTTTGANTARPIFANTVTPIGGSFELGPGTYFIVWQAAGTLSSGPWAPPVVIYDVCETGDGIQSTDYGVTFNYVVDGGALACPQGFPFILEGTIGGGTPTETTTWGQIKATF